MPPGRVSKTAADARAASQGAPDRFVFWLCFWMAFALVGMKLLYLPLSDGFASETARERIVDAAVLSASEAMFALVIGGIGQAVLFFTKRWPAVVRWIRIGLLA